MTQTGSRFASVMELDLTADDTAITAAREYGHGRGVCEKFWMVLKFVAVRT